MRRATASWADRQLRGRGIRDDRVLTAMERVPRDVFVPPDARRQAYDDAALLLPHGQTISQPYVVAVICEALVLRGDEVVLDVGTGSGYQAAVLAELSREVVSVERIPELAEQARRNLDEAGYGDRVEVRVGDGTLGAPDRAPFGGIAVAAAAPDVPRSLYAQLADGARIVLPVGGAGEQLLEVVERTPDGPRARRLIPVRFVPLLGAEGYA
jgi:protein-L-isoaspartate(D-aspartate) O-methyltransferase